MHTRPLASVAHPVGPHPSPTGGRLARPPLSQDSTTLRRRLTPLRLTAPLVAAALLATAMAPSPAHAQDAVFTGTLSTSQQTELAQWGQAYWTRLEGGTPSTAPFTFSTAAMNSPLFNPFYGPRQTLLNVGIVSDTDCMKDLAEHTPLDPTAASKRQAIKDALVDFKIKTDPVTDPAGTTNHVLRILDAATVNNLVVYNEDGKLVSEKLPLDVVVAAGADSQFAEQLTDNSINALLLLTNQAPALVAAAPGTTEAQAMLTGAAPKAGAAAVAIGNLLAQAGLPVNTIERMDVLFGVYGQLPTVYVAFNDCAVLIDATTGAVTAPVKLGSPLNAAALLAAHTEASPPFANRVVTAAGCLVVAAPMWHDTPPTPLTNPAFGPQAPSPGNIPGNWGKWTCVNQGTGCKCTLNGTYTDTSVTPPRVIPVEITCTSGSQGGQAGNCPSFMPQTVQPVAPPPNTAPITPTTPPGYVGAQCSFRYKY